MGKEKIPRQLGKVSKRVDVQRDGKRILKQEEKVIDLAGKVALTTGDVDIVKIVRCFFEALRICLSGKAPKECAMTIVILIVAVLIYLLSPVDAIPDFIPFLGFTDDAAVLFATYEAVRSQLKKILAKTRK